MRSVVPSRRASALFAGLALLLTAQVANAATYRIAIENGETIIKLYVDQGTVRRVGFSGGDTLFDAEMEGDACSREIRLAFTDAPSIQVPYNVCTDAGFRLDTTYN